MNLTCPPEYPHDSELRGYPYKRTLWSEIPPQSAGWWWLLKSGELHVVRVKYEDGQFFYVRSDMIPAFTDHWTNVKNIDGLWAGPIPMPTEP